MNSTRKIKLCFSIITAFCLISLVLYINRLGVESYQLSDWIINYEGGFVRRGLIGATIYHATTTANQLLWGTFFLQSLLFFSTGYLIYHAFSESPKCKEWLLLLLSPAFLFTFFIADPDYGMRKELLVFFSLMLLINGVLKKKWVPYLNGSLLFYLIATLSHELASLCLPFFIYPLWRRAKTFPQDRKLCVYYSIFFAIVAILGMMTAIFFSGSEDTKYLICQSWTERGINPKMCGYSLYFFGLDSKIMFQYLQQEILTRPYIALYTTCLLLSLTPIALSNWWKNRAPALIIVAGALGLSPLFFLGIDWGRWVYIYITLISITMLMDDVHKKISFIKIPFLVILAYSLFWTMPITVYRPQGLLTPFMNSAPNLGIIDKFFTLKKPSTIAQENLTKEWEEILSHQFREIIFYPIEKNSRTQNLISQIAIEKNIPFNISPLNWYGNSEWLSHFSSERLYSKNQLIKEQIEQNQIAKTALYIFDVQGAIQYIKNNNFDINQTNIYRLDGKYLFIPKNFSCNACVHSEKIKKIDPTLIQTPYRGPFSFQKSDAGQNPLLIEGWTPISEDWGTWSNSRVAKIVIPLPKQSPEKLKIKFRALVNTNNPFQTLVIMQNGQLQDPIVLRHFDDNFVEIKINEQAKKDGQINLVIDLPNAKKPQDIGLGNDDRLLGIGIQNAEWSN